MLCEGNAGEAEKQNGSREREKGNGSEKSAIARR